MAVNRNRYFPPSSASQYFCAAVNLFFVHVRLYYLHNKMCILIECSLNLLPTL